DIKDHSGAVAWYRKTFTLPAGAENGKVILEFEGVRQAADFYVNGQHVGLHENGVMALGLDVTAAVKPGENVIAVRTDNDWNYREKAHRQRYQWADRNFNANYGGIPKNVRLHLRDRLYQTLPLFSNLGTTGVYVYATDHDIAGKSAVIHAGSQVRNEHTQPRTFGYEVVIRDMEGKEVATFRDKGTTATPGATVTVRAEARVGDLNFWSWGYGYLYTVTTRLVVDGTVVDSVDTRTGFRKTAFQDGMVTLNDRVIQMHGYAQRTSNEWPAVGMSVPPWLSDFSNRLLVESGGNLVRWMHVTPWKQDVESCDRVGLIQAMPAGDAEKDVTGRRWGQRLEVMRDAIIYNRNNPSILFYEGGNAPISEEHMAELIAIRDRYDPHGGRAIGSRNMLDSKLAEYGGEMLYINKSARIPFWAMEYSRDEGLRKYWDEFSPPYHEDGDGPLHNGQSAATYNRNQDS
ncbi:MAG: beta-galactosidase, partial [Verrucomicrobiaceae bacterium]